MQSLMQLPGFWLRKLGNAYLTRLCRREFETQHFIGLNERPVEYRFVFDAIAGHCPRKVLDVGTGKTALPHLMRTCGCLVTAVDNVVDYWPKGMVNRHYYVLHDNILRTALPPESFDLVTCISVLEHIPEHRQAVASMLSLLRPGGLLAISCPYHERHYVDNVYALAGSVGADKFPFVAQVYSRREINDWCNDNAAEVFSQEYWRFFRGEFWTLGESICPPEKSSREEAHQITCLLMRKGGVS